MKRLSVLLVLAVLLAVFSLAGCDSPSGGSGGSNTGSTATLVVENLTTYDPLELITSLRWNNQDTGTSQLVNFSGGIGVRESKTLSLVEGTYDIGIQTNNGDDEWVYNIRLYSGSTVTLVWDGYYLSRR